MADQTVRDDDQDRLPGERIERWFERRVDQRGLRPRYAAALVVFVWLIAIVTFGILERIVDPHSFKSIWLALWWSIQTVTTVGYGDIVPQATAGKVMGAILMVGGLSFLSILTATITSSFVARRQRQAMARGDDPTMQKLEKISERIEALEAELRRARLGEGEGPKA